MPGTLSCMRATTRLASTSIRPRGRWLDVQNWSAGSESKFSLHASYLCKPGQVTSLGPAPPGSRGTHLPGCGCDNKMCLYFRKAGIITGRWGVGMLGSFFSPLWGSVGGEDGNEPMWKTGGGKSVSMDMAKGSWLVDLRRFWKQWEPKSNGLCHDPL